MDPIVIAPSDRLSRHYARRVEQIFARFNDIRELIQHEGVKGARVEGEVRRLLLDFLPKRYEYGSGIVIDSSGSEVDRSRQEDILVVDKFFNPRLFLDEEPTVYPVEVIYCGIEVKTSLDSEGLKEAINNIASLKRLKFVRETVPSIRGNDIFRAETTGPLGMIFAFDSPIKSAETLLRNYADALKGIERGLSPDFICILNRGMLGISRETSKPRFNLYGLLGRDQSSGRINAMEISPTSGSSLPDEIVNSKGQRYPLIMMNREHYPVDVARTFIGFLGQLYEMLLSKVMTNSNLLEHYIPKQMTHYLYKDYEEETSDGSQPRKVP